MDCPGHDLVITDWEINQSFQKWRSKYKTEGELLEKIKQRWSQLAPESQPIQDAIDKVLFRCYGLSDEEAGYINKRLEEML